MKYNFFSFSLAIIISISLTLLVYHFFIVLDVKEIGIDFVVSDHSGFNIDTDAIHLGTLQHGAEGKRNITIQNIRHIPIKAHIKIIGDIKDYVYVSENHFKLMPGKAKDISFIAPVPYGQELGLYNGTVRIVFTRI